MSVYAQNSDEPLVGGRFWRRLGGLEVFVWVGGQDLHAVRKRVDTDGLDGADGARILATAAPDAKLCGQHRHEVSLGIRFHAEGAGGAVLGAGTASVLGGEGHANGGFNHRQPQTCALLDGEVKWRNRTGWADFAAGRAVIFAHALVEGQMNDADFVGGLKDLSDTLGHAEIAVRAE